MSGKPAPLGGFFFFCVVLIMSGKWLHPATIYLQSASSKVISDWRLYLMAEVTVKLAIGSFSVEVTGEPAYVDKKVDELVSRFLSAWKPSSIEPQTTVSAPLEAGGKKVSPAEFLKKANAKNQMDRALLLGYYLEKTEGISSFTSSDLGQLGKSSKQPFTNPSDAVAKLTGRGLMMSAGDKEGQRAYALTASGETYVETLLEAK
jgi:hypothetical protein